MAYGYVEKNKVVSLT